MKKILVPTDFSENSKSALEFALGWAEKEMLHLEFLYVTHISRNTEWTDNEFLVHSETDRTEVQLKLDAFVQQMISERKHKPAAVTTTVIEGLRADNTILDYCEDDGSLYCICISTRGAGGLQKMLGTNTGNLITHSKIPVIAVPQNYSETEISNVLYASDLENYEDEINKVIEFAQPLHAAVEVLHFTWPDENRAEKDNFSKDYEYGFTLSFPPHNVSKKLINNLHEVVKEKQPSILIMFTNQEKNFWQKLFSPSKTEQISFEIEVPLLVFKK